MVSILIGSVDNSLHFAKSYKSPAYCSLTAVSRISLDNAVKPRHVGLIKELSTDPTLHYKKQS